MLFRTLDIEFKYDDFQALKKQNFSIKKGQNLLIHGPSGCGKTTLINLLSGLIKPTSGKIFFEDNDYNNLNEDELCKIRAKYFGFIFQKFHLINHLNVEQNISLANPRNYIKVEELIKELGLIDKKKLMVRDLSVGEAQRVAVARAIVNEPKVLFADEPTSSLDEINTHKVIELIFSQAKQNKTTLILSTHDNRVKKYFSNVLEIQK